MIAPELMKKLNPDPPKPFATGYQLLPKIQWKDDDYAALKKDAPIGVATPAFNWPKARASALEDRDKAALLAADVTKALTEHELDGLISRYQDRDRARSLMDSIIEYNKTWQKMIADEIPRWNQLTKQWDDVVRRAEVADLLKKREDPALRKEFNEISSRIDSIVYRPPAERSFFRLVRRPGGKIQIRIPMVTDIEDEAYLKKVEAWLERFWSLDEFSIDLVVRRISPRALYGKEPVPKKGEPIDVAKHRDRFPKNAVILTTGANTLGADANKHGMPFITLPSSDISAYALAHEFGHNLGLHDAYLRGYRDLGEDGYEVREAIPDTSDIMCNSNRGVPRRRHFEIVTKTLERLQSKKR